MKLETAEATFILIFGAMHFAIPFLFPPNPKETVNFLLTLPIADAVIPGCFLLATSAILFCLTKNRYLATLLVFLFSGGIAFHLLYLSGAFPPVITVPTPLILVAGVIADSLSVITIYDYYKKMHKPSRLIPQ